MEFDGKMTGYHYNFYKWDCNWFSFMVCNQLVARVILPGVYSC